MASRYHFEKEKPSFGGQLGASLGTGLSRGLSALAESKLDKMLANDQRSQDKQKLVSLGIPEHEAEYLSHQDPDTQWQTARQWLIAGGAPEEMVPKSLDDEWNISPEQEEAAQQQVQQLLGQQQGQQGPAGALQQLGQPQQQQPGMAQALGMQQAPAIQPQAAQQQMRAQPASPNSAVQKKPKSLGEAFNISDAKGSGESKADDTAAQKETKEYYDKVSDEARAAKNNEIRLKKMEKLIKEGKLNSPTFSSGIKFLHLGGYGPDLSSWLNADTQEFDKLSKDFIRDAKQIFGSRITDIDLKTFLDTIPNITQSDEAKKRVIKTLRVFNTAATARKNAMDQIIEYNGGKRPLSLDTQVERNVAPLLDQLAGDFKENEGNNQPFIGQLLKSLPPASQYPADSEIRDKKSGVLYRNDGNQWIKV